MPDHQARKARGPVLCGAGPVVRVRDCGRCRFRFLRSGTGATAIEYALMAAVVAITAFAGLRLMGGEAGALWNTAGNSIIRSMQRDTTP
ncbi:MAG: Flp family type IVb pilin [Geminicoccaceae bacterium]|nr:Flp family type IVb pilin [Geminicoccaceae bacterium]